MFLKHCPKNAIKHVLGKRSFDPLKKKKHRAPLCPARNANEVFKRPSRTLRTLREKQRGRRTMGTIEY